MKAGIIWYALFAFALVCKAQTTSVVTAAVRDVTGAIVPAGQITFELKPSADTTISGNARFTPQTVVCSINQASTGPGGTITSLARVSNVVTATFSAQTSFVVGDVLSLGSWSDASFDGASAFTVTAVSGVAPWTVTWNQTAADSTATSGFISALRSSPGPGSCTLTQNTALTPAGTYYLVTLWPNFAPTASFNFYALSTPVDLSSVVPTPSTIPAYSFFDLFSTQTVTGNKTFSGPVTFTGAVSGPFVTSVALTAPLGEFTVSGSPVTGSGTLAIGKASVGANTVAAGPTSGISAPWAFRALVPADFGTGTANTNTFLRGDQSWQVVPQVSGSFTVGHLVTVQSTTPLTLQDAGAPSSNVAIQSSARSTLGADIPLAATTATTVLTRNVTMPSSGCPCRVLASYSIYTSAVNSSVVNAWVTDGTNIMASRQHNTHGGDQDGIGGTEASPVTYANSAVITFTLTVFVAGSSVTVKAAPFEGSGTNTWLSLSVATSN